MNSSKIYNVDPTERPLPTLFWSFGEGEGCIADDFRGHATSHAGNIHGATWEADVCPDQPSMPVATIDADGLDIRAILFNPAASENQPAIPASDSAPSLMMSSDGLLHLYYRDQNNKAAVLHMSTSTERARFVVLQENSSNEWMSMLTLVARQTGTLSGTLNLHFSGITNGKYDAITFSHPDQTLQETWLNVPARLDEFVDVINGKAAVPDII